MKSIQTIKHTILTGAVALTILLSLAPHAQAASTSSVTMKSDHSIVLPEAKGGKDGEETHG